MSIQDLGAIGEFLSSIVVLITLIYLAIQTKHTRQATQANLQWTRANAYRDLQIMWATNPEAADLIAEFGTREEDYPTSDDFDPRRFRYVAMNRSILEILQAFLLSAQTEQDRELAIQRINFQMQIPGFRASWRHIRAAGIFYPEFIEIVEAAFANNDSGAS